VKHVSKDLYTRKRRKTLTRKKRGRVDMPKKRDDNLNRFCGTLASTECERKILREGKGDRQAGGWVQRRHKWGGFKGGWERALKRNGLKRNGRREGKNKIQKKKFGRKKTSLSTQKRQQQGERGRKSLKQRGFCEFEGKQDEIQENTVTSRRKKERREHKSAFKHTF